MPSSLNISIKESVPEMVSLVRRSVGVCRCGTGGRSIEIQLFGQHGDHTGNLLLLAVAGVLGPRLKVGGHHVVDPGQDLHDLQLLAELVEDIAEGLDEPGPAPGVPPGVVSYRSSTSHSL